MYVQYFLQQNRKGKLPLLLWHGGGLTGVTYETKPDGKPGWLNYFLRKGWDIYVSDAVERGRSGWTDTFKGDAGRRCRSAIRGSASASGRSARGMPTRRSAATYPGAQFPIEAYEQFMKQGVPRWVTTDDQIVAAYIELVDKVVPLRRHGAQPGRRVRLQGRRGAARQGEGADRGRAVRAGEPRPRSAGSRARRCW